MALPREAYVVLPEEEGERIDRVLAARDPERSRSTIKRWIDEGRYLHALNYCMLLPGPEAQQLATYIGWLLHGVRGGLVAGLLFVLPGLAVILGLSSLYALYQEASLVTGLFFGLKAAVLAIVVGAGLGASGAASRTLSWHERSVQM